MLGANPRAGGIKEGVAGQCQY